MILKTIIDRIWTSGEWPEQWVTSELIVLPKVAGTQECSKHRTISLISHASKVLLEIIRKRFAPYVQAVIADEQFGFVPGKGTTEAIITLRNIIEKAVTKQDDQELWMLFIDYKKAFDTVYHPALWKTLEEFGFPQHLIWLLSKLYDKAKGLIRIEDEKTDLFSFGKGVRQGCLVSPILFIIAGEYIMRAVAEKHDNRLGYNIGGRAVWNIRYADDTTLLARTRTELKEVAEMLREESLKAGLEINSSKTNVMTINGQGEFAIQGEPIQAVDSFKFLGSKVTTNGDSSTDIRARIAMGRSTTTNLGNVWRSPAINIHTKVRLAKALVWSVALYGCESWTLKKEDERRLEAFEMWLWRRILNVRWTERKTNVWVRQQVGVKEEAGILMQARKRKVKKFCHWKRRPDSLVLATIEGMTPGRNRRGRRRASWFDNIRTWTGLDNSQLHECARAREMPMVRADYGI